MMLILKTFEQQFPHFPIVLQDETPRFKEICSENLKELIRLQRVPAQYRSPADNERLKDIDFIARLIDICPTDSFHFFHLIQDEMVQFTLELQVYVSQIWTNEIQNQLIDTDDPSPLFHIHLFQDLFYQPAQIAGLMIALINQNISDDEIIQSGMLHHYFKQSSHVLSDVQAVYQIIQARAEENPKISVFLAKIAMTSCDMEHNPHMTLDGRLAPVSMTLNSVEIKAPAYSHFFSEEQFFQALKLFQDDFIILLLQIPHDAHHSFVNLYFKEWLSHQSEETIEHLYSKILHEVHPIYLMRIFQNLTQLTPPALIEKLFEEDKSLFWILLACAPKQLKKFSKKQILELAQEQVINEKNQEFVALVCKNRKFQLLHDKLYYALFQLQVSSAQPDLESSIIDDLFAYENTLSWCSEHEKLMLKKLLSSIDSNVIDFSIDHFINIKDIFYGIHFQLDTLRALGLEIKKFPSDYYSFSSLILSRLFELNAKKDIPRWLNILTYHTEKDKEMQNTLKKALVLEWFKQSSNLEHLISIAAYLHHYFGYSIIQIQEILKSKKINLSQIPFYSPEALSCYLQLFSDSEILSQLIASIHTAPSSILKFSLKKPDFFLKILENLSPDKILIILLRYTIKAEPLWFSITLNDKILELLSEKLNEEDFQVLINLKNKLQQNILHLNHQNKQFIQMLSDQDILFLYTNLIIEKDCFGQTPLFLSLQNPEIFQIFFSYIPATERFQTILHLDYGQLNLLEMGISKPEIIQTVFDNLNDYENLIISQLYGEEIVLRHHHQQSLIEQLLTIFNPLILEEFLFQTLGDGKRIIDYLSKNIEVLKMTLNKCPSDKVYEFLTSDDCRLLEHISSHHPEALFEIFDLIEDIHLLHLLESDLFFKTLFQSKAILYAYLDRLSDTQMQIFLSHQTHYQEDWIDLLPIDPQILDAILSLTVSPRELINPKLIGKLINHPLCLKVLIQYIPEESKTYWIFSLKDTFLQNLKCIESLLCLFNVLPASQHVNLLILKHRRYQSMHQWLIQNFRHLLQALPMFDTETSTLINHKIIQHSEYLESFVERPERVPVYLELLNPQQTFEFLLSLCQNYAKRPLDSNIKLAILKFAINYQGNITSFSPRHFSAEQQKNPMWSAVRNAKFFKDCIPALETRGLTLEM